MKLPVPKFLATASADVQIADGTDENGALNIVKKVGVKARLEQSNAVVYTKEGTKVTLRAKLFIFENLDEIPDNASGFCTVEGIKYDIVKTSKKRTPDNSVNHIVLELV